MTKALVIIALLAISYIASASTDVPAWALPLSSTDLTTEEDVYLSKRCSTTDGKFYYIDKTDAQGDILQVWDSKAQTQGTPISLANTYTAVNALKSSLGATGNSQQIIQCVGTAVYISVAYTNATATGLQLFLVDPSGSVTIYSLPLNNTDLTKSLTGFLSLTAQTTDGKLYYQDTTQNNNPVLQVWDSASEALGTIIDLTNATAQKDSLDRSLGDPSTFVSVIQGIGSSVYINAAYENDTASGVRLFLAQAAGPVPYYDLPYNKVSVSSDQVIYMSQICSTNDGKYYYKDQANDNTWTLQQWNSNTQASADSASLIDFDYQLTVFKTDAGKNAQYSEILQCAGNSVYYNVAFTNGSTTSIELFQLQKSAVVLSFSAAILAFVALLL